MSDIRPKIALFVGSDIAAHLIMNNVVAEMDRMGFEAILFMPKHPFSSRAQLPELKEGAFYERTLLNETVYPFVENNFHNGAKNLSPKQLADRFDIVHEQVENVNDPAFIKRIADDEAIIGAISIRCFQIFKKEIIQTLYDKDSRKIFLNLHPGLLPEYRGVMSTMWRMFHIASGQSNGSKDYGCTIHRIDENIDTGHIFGTASQTLDASQSGFMANIGLVKPASRLVVHVLQQIQDGETLYGHPQINSDSYYTYPKSEDLVEWKKAGIRLTEPKEEIISLLVHKFSKAGSVQGNQLEEVIRGNIHTWEAKTLKNGNGSVTAFKANDGNSFGHTGRMGRIVSHFDNDGPAIAAR